MKTLFSVAQVAKICQVAPWLANRWFSSGSLRGFYIQDTTFRRVPRQNLIQFLPSQGKTLDEAESRAKILFIGYPADAKLAIVQNFPATDYEVHFAASDSEANMTMYAHLPDCVVVDFSVGATKAFDIAWEIRKSPLYEPLLILGCTNSTFEANEDDKNPFNEIFQQSNDSANRIQDHVKAHVLWE